MIIPPRLVWIILRQTGDEIREHDYVIILQSSCQGRVSVTRFFVPHSLELYPLNVSLKIIILFRLDWIILRQTGDEILEPDYVIILWLSCQGRVSVTRFFVPHLLELYPLNVSLKIIILLRLDWIILRQTGDEIREPDVLINLFIPNFPLKSSRLRGLSKYTHSVSFFRFSLT